MLWYLYRYYSLFLSIDILTVIIFLCWMEWQVKFNAEWMLGVQQLNERQTEWSKWRCGSNKLNLNFKLKLKFNLWRPASALFYFLKWSEVNEVNEMQLGYMFAGFHSFYFTPLTLNLCCLRLTINEMKWEWMIPTHNPLHFLISFHSISFHQSIPSAASHWNYFIPFHFIQ